MPINPVEHTGQNGQKTLVRQVIGPQPEHPPRPEEPAQAHHPLFRIKVRVTGIQQGIGGVINIKEDGVKPVTGIIRIEAAAARQGKEIRLVIAAAGILRKPCAIGHQSTLMPINHRRQSLFMKQGRHEIFIIEFHLKYLAATQCR